MKKMTNLMRICQAVVVLLLLSILVSCNKIESIYSDDFLEVSEDDYYHFNTVQSSSIVLSLGIAQETVFYLYEENPVILLADESEEMEPLYTGVTDSLGNFTGTLMLPAYVKKVWLVSQQDSLPLLLEVNVEVSNHAE